MKFGFLMYFPGVRMSVAEIPDGVYLAVSVILVMFGAKYNPHTNITKSAKYDIKPIETQKNNSLKLMQW